MTTTTTVQIQGEVDPRFERVREAFANNFRDHREVGAAVAVYLDGRPVVDLWAGRMHPDGDAAWERDTIVNVWSMTKGMTATCAHILADRDLLDYDAPVAQYWPEFGKLGKESIPVRWLLSHQAGLVAVDPPLKPGDHEHWDTMIHALEETTPQWEPGTKNGYHMITFGWLVGEVVRRISGAASLGAFFRDEIAAPLGADFFIGTPASEDPRIASIIQPAPNEIFVRPPGPDAPTNPLMERSLLHDSELVMDPNSRGWRGAELPGGNGHGNARAVARVYSALAQGGELDGVRLMSPERVDIAREVHVDSPDEVLTMRTRRSLGYMHPVPDTGDRRGPEAFGHGGAGGSNGFADTEHQIGFGYAMNQMWAGDFGTIDPRAQLLAGAVYESLGIKTG
ncbi:MAG: serine hydrolase [Chloroflexi bacterium]|nr:serine hydrolase [Chloroflexota bacterium]MDA1146974.1 serine hydrolase [Chloroflexota bacterium]